MDPTHHAYAIVGMACRFPGADNTNELWEMLCAGTCALEPTPPDRMRPARLGGYMRDIDTFDPLLFGISPAEAAIMDPQQRKLIEVAFECMQDAGIELHGTNTGVFVGAGMTDHAALTANKATNVGTYSATSSALSILANRVSYVLDLSGPSMVVDTACSSSGAALATGLGFARAGACDMLLVGGVNYLRSPGMMRAFELLGVLSPTDGCKPFSADADGYARSEGAGVILLKRLDLAERDGNRIYAVVHDAHMNEDGRNESMTMPNGDKQLALLRRAYAPDVARDLAYVEMHGTGTSVGDPIEAGAMHAFLCDAQRASALSIGSVKANLGHMECASTIGSIIKVALMAYHGKLVPSIKCATPSPNVDWTHMRVQTSVEPLPPASWLGVNAFGFGGSNVHVVMRSHAGPADTKNENETKKKERVPLVIGADSEASLRRMMAAGGDAATLCIRSQLNPLNRPYKMLAFDVGSNAPRGADHMTVVPTSSPLRPPLVFVFPGQGSQHVDMGRILYRAYPVFASAIDRVASAYHLATGLHPVHDIDMFRGEATERSRAVYDIDYSLICLFTHQVALFELVRSAGVPVGVVVGHSVGELAAAYACGMADLDTLVHIVAVRTRVMKRHDGLGGMMAVSDPPDIADVSGVWVACYNSATDVTLGGTHEALETVASVCRAERRFHRRLDVTNAYHTPLLGCMEDEMCAALTGVQAHAPSCACYSTVTGARVLVAHTARYFWDNVVSPVKFFHAVRAIAEDIPGAMFVECGAHPVLRKYISDMCGTESVALGTRSGREDEVLLRALVAMQQRGIKVDWAPFGDGASACMPPTYAYDTHTFTIRQHKDDAALRLSPPAHPLLHECVMRESEKVLFKTYASTACIPFLRGHVVQNTVVVPAAMFIELSIAAAVSLVGPIVSCPIRVRDVEVLRALPLLTDDIICFTEATLDARVARVRVFTTEFGTHCECSVDVDADIHTDAAGAVAYNEPIEVTNLYDMFAEIGLHYDENFKLLRDVRRGDGTASAVLDATRLDLGGYHIHPCVLDDMLHSAFAASFDCSSQFLPSRFAGVDVLRTPPVCEAVRAVLVDATFDESKNDIALYDDTGAACVVITGFVSSRNATTVHPVPDLCYKVRHAVYPADVALDEPDYVGWGAHNDRIDMEMRILTRRAAASIALHRAETCETDPATTHGARYRALCDLPQPASDVVDTNFHLTELLAEGRTLAYIERHWGELRTDPGAIVSSAFVDGAYAELYRDGGFFHEARFVVPHMLSVIRANPTARILEIGSGTGGLTRMLIPHLDLTQCTYTYSDVSSYFLDIGRAEFGDKLQYRKVDIAEPFGVGEYDLIIGLDVVHAVPDIARALRNMHDALDTNGRLAIVDVGAVPWLVQLLFGVFAGWFQEGRDDCFLTPISWRETLRACGFDDVHTRSHYGVDVDECFGHILLTARRHERDVWEGTPHELLDIVRSGAPCPTAIRVLDDDNVTEALALSLAYEGHAVRAARTHGAPTLLPYVAREYEGGDPFRAECGAHGDIRFRRFVPTALRDDEVAVVPDVSSINFKDIVIANGLVRIDAPIGAEMGGTVVRVGAGVTCPRVGDKVYGFCTSGAFGNYCIASSRLLRVSSGDMRADVSTLTPYATAWYALVDRAHVTSGMRVLVHAACGALGIAAIHVCQLHGCTVVATAGTDAKRQLLRDMGIVEVHSSREFLPAGCRVDVVVSALAGEYVYDGLRALRDGGHFIDVSKKDMLEDAPLRRRVLLKNVSYHSVHLDNLIHANPDKVAELMATVAGLPTKPMPVDRTFPLSRLDDAMAYMARGVHVGKIMIEHDDVAAAAVRIDAPTAPLAADVTFVVTGGMGEMGMYLVDRMVTDGARYFVVTTRAEARTRIQSIALARLEARGARVCVVTVDARDAAPVCPGDFPPVGVVVHMAMVLRDKRAEDLSAEDVEAVWDTKVKGIDVLLAAFDGARVVAFSSVVSITGNYAQAAYAAANARLETYAATHERVQVLHVSAIDDCGVCAHDLELRQAMRAKGFMPDTSVRDVYTALRILILDERQKQIVMRSPSVTMLNLIAAPRATIDTGSAEDAASTVMHIVCSTLELPPGRYSEDTPWVDFGADSLASVTLANKVNRAMGTSITQMEILGLLTTRGLLARL
jgi:acyl transferase domain-containing protein/NADPH:quinone reductase-like Zn-dependent oxidoreductase/SAM-dependent methyltransferase